MKIEANIEIDINDDIITDWINTFKNSNYNNIHEIPISKILETINNYWNDPIENYFVNDIMSFPFKILYINHSR